MKCNLCDYPYGYIGMWEEVGSYPYPTKKEKDMKYNFYCPNCKYYFLRTDLLSTSTSELTSTTEISSL